MMSSFYYQDLYSTPEMREAFSDEARIQAWIDTELALVKAQVTLGIVPAGVDVLMEESFQFSRLDLKEMKTDYDKIGFPILPFVKQLSKLCDKETARWIHYGATTQDILDTGTALQMKKALGIVERDLNAIIKTLAAIVEKHKDTVMAGRTFQQLAAPITFGFKAAVWLDELLRHRTRLNELRGRVLVGQCSGAVGTFATLGDQGLEVQRQMMSYLGLGVPSISWHTARDSWSELIHLFAMVGATLAKIANEISMLMRSEIAELSEPIGGGRGASSTMPQKRNPILSEPIQAIAPKLRELSGSQLTAMVQEHERGVWHMTLEWLVIPEAFLLLSASLHHTFEVLDGLIVNEQAMRSNLDINGGTIMAEAAMMGLASKIGKAAAHDVITEISGRVYRNQSSLRDELFKDVEISKLLTSHEIEDLMNPLNYIGSAREMIKQVLEKV